MKDEVVKGRVMVEQDSSLSETVGTDEVRIIAKVSQTGEAMLINQAGPPSSIQTQCFSLPITPPPTGSKKVPRIMNSPEMELPGDHTMDDINASLNSITCKLTNLQCGKLDSFCNHTYFSY